MIIIVTLRTDSIEIFVDHFANHILLEGRNSFIFEIEIIYRSQLLQSVTIFDPSCEILDVLGKMTVIIESKKFSSACKILLEKNKNEMKPFALMLFSSFNENLFPPKIEPPFMKI